MASANGAADRWRLDPFAVGLALLAIAGIAGEVLLTVLGKPIPGALDSIIYTCSGAIAGAYGINRAKNGNGAYGNGRDVAGGVGGQGVAKVG